MSMSRKHLAGKAQESKVAYQLDRHLGTDKNAHVLHDLKFNINGFNTQIDHLVIYPCGFIIIESKSVKGEVKVNALGEWERSFGSQWQGMPSPIQQASVQTDALKKLLSLERENLLDKILGVQGGFGGRRYDALIAISSSARIDRENLPDQISDQTVKTEFLLEKIKAISGIGKGRFGSAAKRLLSTNPAFNDQEMSRIFAFLSPMAKADQGHAAAKPIKSPPPESIQPAAQESPGATLACKKCGEKTDLKALHGRYGYFVKCGACGTNTAIKCDCVSCGSSSTRARKDREAMFIDCSDCNVSARLTVQWGGK